MKTINPYLIFNGTCEHAFNFYKSVFGGDFLILSRFKDIPADAKYTVAESDKERIMHVSLPILEGIVLMGSDSDTSKNNHAEGNNMYVSIGTDSLEETTKIYDELSADGNIEMLLDKTFWGAYFGSFVDKFGIQWMVNCEI